MTMLLGDLDIWFAEMGCALVGGPLPAAPKWVRFLVLFRAIVRFGIQVSGVVAKLLKRIRTGKYFGQLKSKVGLVPDRPMSVRSDKITDDGPKLKNIKT